ncbi:MAG: hypothetical protein B6I24_09995 [Bacteroidetes bacterium 4572_128]|nr:MAG: hypothetical protein B6I24_09995 [Bacteroidetes bacterium 4572_128]
MPGTIIKFKEGSKLIVYGQIEANGTSENQITFTSYKEEPSKGDWDYIKFAGESTNSLKYCNILYAGGYGSNSASILLNYGNLKMENCLIEHSASSGIIIDNSSNGFQSFVRNTIKNCDSYDIEIFPNYVHMLGEQNVMENNGILIKAGNFSQNDETWKKQTVPYLIDEYVSISGTLRIQEGTTIAFKEYAYLSVGKDYYPGELIAKGTSSEKIIFTSAMDEKNEGDWGDIKFLNAGNSVLKNCIIEYGGGDTESMINTSPTSEYAIENTLLTIENCIIQYSESDGISFNPYLGFDKFRNNTIENITGYAINICPDYVSTIGSGNIINNKGILINTENIYNISSLWLKRGSYDIGKLTALGTASEKIIFTSNEMEKERGDFVGLKFSNLASNSALDHCIVEYGGSVKGNIVMDTGFMSVSNSIIKYSDNYGIYIYESYMDPTLEDNTFQYNVSGDIFYGN